MSKQLFFSLALLLSSGYILGMDSFKVSSVNLKTAVAGDDSLAPVIKTIQKLGVADLPSAQILLQQEEERVRQTTNNNLAPEVKEALEAIGATPSHPQGEIQKTASLPTQIASDFLETFRLDTNEVRESMHSCYNHAQLIAKAKDQSEALRSLFNKWRVKFEDQGDALYQNHLIRSHKDHWYHPAFIRLFNELENKIHAASNSPQNDAIQDFRESAKALHKTLANVRH